MSSHEPYGWHLLPKTKQKKKPERVNIRIPTRMIEEVQQIVDTTGLYQNRQQFVEAAIREKIEKIEYIKAVTKDVQPSAE